MTEFQVDLMSHDHYFKRGRCYDGVLLWNYLMKCVRPTTNVSASNHKELLDAATLKDFQHDVRKFNNWFVDRRRDIIRDEGADKHGEHVRHSFKTHLTATNEDLISNIKIERIEWMTRKKPESCSHRDLMDFALTNFNNLSSLKIWERPDKKKEDDPFLAFMTEVRQEISSLKNSDKHIDEKESFQGSGRGEI